MNPDFRLSGLTAAAHTPFDQDGKLAPARIALQAEHLARHEVNTVFVCGSTGESHSLTIAERKTIADEWLKIGRTGKIKVVVHVGHNCLTEAAELARHAEAGGAAAVASLCPSYFRPANTSALVASMRSLAAACPETPFYYYDIPALTGVHLDMPEFLYQASDQIPNLQGLKFTNPDLATAVRCRNDPATAWDILWGVDEVLLAAVVSGLHGAVGSTYNFAAPIAHRILRGAHDGRLESADRAQQELNQLILLLKKYGYFAAAKHLMGRLGVQVGSPRLPILPLSAEQTAALDQDLEPILPLLKI